MISKKHEFPAPTGTAFGQLSVVSFQNRMINMVDFTDTAGAVRITVETSALQAGGLENWKKLSLVLNGNKANAREHTVLIPCIASNENVAGPAYTIEFNRN